MKIPEDQYIKVGTVNTRYWMAGEGSPVILLHGVTNSVEDWLLNFHVLAENCRVYGVDLIGHGKTDKPLSASYHVKDLARFIAAFMDAIQVEKAHLIGHSLGGMISFYLAIDFPDYVDKLVVVSSAGLSKWMPMFMRLITVPVVGELLGTMMANEDFDKHLEAQRKNWPDATVATDELIRLRYEVKDWQVMTKPILKLFRTIANFFGVKKREYLPVVQGLPSIKNPLLVVWGRQDELSPVANTQVIAENSRHAQIEMFDDCGHDAMIEKPDKFNQLVLYFLKD